MLLELITPLLMFSVVVVYNSASAFPRLVKNIQQIIVGFRVV